MWTAISQIQEMNPAFVSVTYGAGGTTRDYTHAIAKRIAAENRLKAAAHLTCVGADTHTVNTIASEHWNAGVRHIVALRGDPPKGTVNYVPYARGYAYATDLVRGLKNIADFEISVAAFPEKHPESRSIEHDIEILKVKDGLGATRAITQFFFEDAFYLRLRDLAFKAKITMPLVPGIIVVNNFLAIKKFSASCGTSIPLWMEEKFSGLQEHEPAHDEVAIEIATRQCQHLKAEGVDFFHFYSMNRGDLIKSVMKAF